MNEEEHLLRDSGTRSGVERANKEAERERERERKRARARKVQRKKREKNVAARMTMATETENNGPESKEIKDVKEMKEALKDEALPDNKQEEKDAAKKDEAAGKKDDDAAAAAAAGGTNAAPAKANTVHHPDYEKDVVYLYQFPRTPLLPSLSPYGLKVETWLRLNNIKYEVSVRVNVLSLFYLFFSTERTFSR